MLVVRSFVDVPLPARGGVITIGNFDGVHRGHQALIQTVRDRAERLGAPSGVLLFDPHPRAFFQPDKPLFTLTPMAYRLQLLAGLGLDFAAVLPFEAELANLSAAQFVTKILVDGFAARYVVVGHDFKFGKGRTGDDAMLEAEGRRQGFGVGVQAAERDGVTVVSSSLIREALRRGDVDSAARQLGRPWSMEGNVISGAGRGAGLGYPTANIGIAPGTELAHGIYAARVWVAGAAHAAVAYHGKRPTFDNGIALLEAFLIDFDADLYGKFIRVELVAFIRPDQKFSSADALKAQMERDVIEACAKLDLSRV